MFVTLVFEMMPPSWKDSAPEIAWRNSLLHEEIEDYRIPVIIQETIFYSELRQTRTK